MILNRPDLGYKNLFLKRQGLISNQNHWRAKHPLSFHFLFTNAAVFLSILSLFFPLSTHFFIVLPLSHFFSPFLILLRLFSLRFVLVSYILNIMYIHSTFMWGSITNKGIHFYLTDRWHSKIFGQPDNYLGCCCAVCKLYMVWHSGCVGHNRPLSFPEGAFWEFSE